MGREERDIHTTTHGNPKWHHYGKHGDATKDYISIDTLLTDKFFSGKSLSDLVGTVDFEFC